MSQRFDVATEQIPSSKVSGKKTDFSLHIVMIIIVKHNKPICLKNSSSEAQQTKSFGIIINGDRQKSSLEHGITNKLWWKSNFKQICFTKDAYSFRR